MSCRRWCPLLAMLSLAIASPAQGEPAAAAPVLGPFGPGPAVHRDRLCVKIVDAADLELVAGQLRSRSGADLGALRELLVGHRVEPLVPDVPRAALDELYQEACRVLPPGRRPGHMAHWLRVIAGDAEQAARLRTRLAAHPWVEHVYFEPELAPATVGNGDPPPPTPPFMSQQDYFAPSPTGVGLRQAQGILGARGQGVQLRMVEFDWFFGHEDISKLVPGNFIGGLPSGTLGSANHGVAGSSILVGDRNCWGVTGGVDEADIRFVGIDQNGGIANSVLVATVNSQPGDVLLMVLQFLLGQLGVDDFVPVEYLQANFDAVLTATSNGRILVCSAANGYRSLDDPRHLRRFDRSYRDSGAIMVAATDGMALVRAPYCNYGSRIDANGWGENVVSAGYGTLFYGNNDPRQAYTAGYSGTSAATPIVCAAVVALQGAARRQLGRSLTTAEIRTLLQLYGASTPQTIGKRPDVQGMLQALGIVDGLQPAQPDVATGGSVSVALSPGSAAGGNGAVLFASFATGDTDFGLNRNLHLDLQSTQTVGVFLFGSGQAVWNLTVPNVAELSGSDLYLQALVLLPGGGLHVTNSGQISVL